MTADAPSATSCHSCSLTKLATLRKDPLYHSGILLHLQVAATAAEEADDVLRDYELSDNEESDQEALVEHPDEGPEEAATSDDETDNNGRAPLSRDETGGRRGGRAKGRHRSGGGSSKTASKQGGSTSNHHGGKRGRGRGRRGP